MKHSNGTAHYIRQGLWVPAFAGTTRKMLSLRSSQ